MLFNPEIKTAVISVEEYCRKYRNPDEFIQYCKVCPCYGNIWCCPPFDFDPGKSLMEFRSVCLIGMRVSVDDYLKEIISDPVTIGDMAEFITKDCRRYLDPVILGLERAFPGSRAFHAGRCYRCQYCARLKGNRCIHPNEMRYSLESYGFDVARTAEDLLGFSLEWSGDSLPEHISFISALFTKEEIQP